MPTSNSHRAQRRDEASIISTHLGLPSANNQVSNPLTDGFTGPVSAANAEQGFISYLQRWNKTPWLFGYDILVNGKEIAFYSTKSKVIYLRTNMNLSHKMGAHDWKGQRRRKT